MDSYNTAQAMAGGALALTLIEVLFDAEIITKEQARKALMQAGKLIGSTSPEAPQAHDVLALRLRGKFSER